MERSQAFSKVSANFGHKSSDEKYGVDNFEFTVIEEHYTVQDINDAEEFWISFFNTCNPEYGYNIRPGGYNSTHSPETGRKISIKNTGRKQSESEIVNRTLSLRKYYETHSGHWLGRKLPEAHKAKFTRKGAIVSEATKQKNERSR